MRTAVGTARRKRAWDENPGRGRIDASVLCRALLWVSLAVLAANLLAPRHATAETSPNDQIGERLARSADPVEVGLAPLDALMTVPDPTHIWVGDTTDADLAYAVSLGNDPDLEKRNPFRKHNFDLFRAERPVLVGEREMVVRFRVRAKTTNTMSVELKF